MEITFYFTIQVLLPNRHARQRHNSNGQWLPPKAQGNNLKLKRNGQIATSTFHYNSTRQPPQTIVAALPPASSLRTFGTYSIYHCEGLIHAVPYDAHALKVHDGREFEHDEGTESGSSDEDDTELRPDWRELAFRDVTERAERFPSLSYASADAQHRRLRAQRPDQLWANYLLPDRYQRRRDMTNIPRIGGMVGHLPLLIGLAAMALPSHRWAELLPTILVNPPNENRAWHVPSSLADRIGRGTQWVDRQGLVVTVYLDPQGSSPATLQSYERGLYGPIFT